MAQQMFVLFEHASGYGLFKVREFEEVGTFLPEVEASSSDVSKFKQVVKLVGYRAFTSAASSLENINAISEGLITDELSAFLETNLPKVGKKAGIILGVTDPKLGAAINEKLSIPVTHIGVIPEVVRGIRTHLTHFVKGLTNSSMKQTELGLGHSYSRGKVKFNVNRVDNMIIQSIALVDQLDKDVNTFAMRIKEWYSYHFPELAKLVTDNYKYALCANFIKDRHTLSQESVPKLEEFVMDSAVAQAIFDASRMSMGMDISPIDVMNIERFAKRVIGLSKYRQQLSEYLKAKMSAVAPNLATLIGDVVGARLISHAGSLINLAKYPASTVQILGAEKALFRAIKTRSNTPKYGLIFHSSFISRAGPTNKGRISRYLANKCSIACRIDCFTENLTSVFGERLREQVEDRLNFYTTGDIPKKNEEVMSEALADHTAQVNLKETEGEAEKCKPEKAFNGEVVQEDTSASKRKRDRKKLKKESLASAEVKAEVEEQVPPATEGESEPATGTKKKKKKNKHIAEEEQPQENGGTNEQEEEDELEPPKKKKKVQKELNGSVEEEEAALALKSPKKKKKKKQEGSGVVEEQMNTSIESPKKKKKKKSAVGAN
ncbi:hypothetical protein Pcinc_016886 [Petrolisthes cinctipes]|uniref:Nucleolar protein 56 n=1 Tax=Petrolisthes cinctipes TaxID=88211 RepID=A0AAE1KLB9_PETCI|nr:hypothetical protein Pcinc_016886 [Petrolisthes cinctipes]